MLYSYYCEKCGKYFELLVPLKYYNMEIKCKYCGKVLQKLITAPMFRIK